MSSNHRDFQELPYELRLARNEAATANPMRGALLDALYALSLPHEDDSGDSSGNESRSWGRNARRRRMAEASIDEYESGQPALPQTRAAATGRTSLTERETFTEYFGDADRRAQSPSGRGWQNVADIATGERITEQEYGHSNEAFEDTSLAEPDLPEDDAEVFSHAEERRAQAAEDEVHEQNNAARNMLSLIRREQRQLARVEVTHQHQEALNAHRRSGEGRRAEDEFLRRAEAFARNDPEAYEEWFTFCRLAYRCSTSMSRRFQIIQWYTGGPHGSIHDSTRRVPDNLLRQIRRVEIYYTRLARLETNLHVAQMNDRSREGRTISQMQREDDNAWAANAEREAFGYEEHRTPNGFSRYIPRGTGEALLRHLTANFYARETRVQHAAEVEFLELRDRMLSFVNDALLHGIATLTGLGNSLGPEFQQRIRPIELAVSGYPIERHDYEGPTGPVASNHGRPRQSSHTEPLENRVPDRSAQAAQTLPSNAPPPFPHGSLGRTPPTPFPDPPPQDRPDDEDDEDDEE